MSEKLPRDSPDQSATAECLHDTHNRNSSPPLPRPRAVTGPPLPAPSCRRAQPLPSPSALRCALQIGPLFSQGEMGVGKWVAAFPAVSCACPAGCRLPDPPLRPPEGLRPPQDHPKSAFGARRRRSSGTSGGDTATWKTQRGVRGAAAPRAGAGNYRKRGHPFADTQFALADFCTPPLEILAGAAPTRSAGESAQTGCRGEPGRKRAAFVQALE
eukprot:11562142-Alexandrium_andersonii.AAC.1